MGQARMAAQLLREIGQKHFAPLMERPEAKALWQQPLLQSSGPEAAARDLGVLQARLQHVAGLEMLYRQQAVGLLAPEPIPAASEGRLARTRWRSDRPSS